MQRPGRKNSSSTPNSIYKAFLTVVWNSRFRVSLLTISLLTTAAFVFWKTVPETNKSAFLSWIVTPKSPTADLRITIRGPVSGELDPEIKRIEHRIASLFAGELKVVPSADTKTITANDLVIDVTKDRGDSSRILSGATLTKTDGSWIAGFEPIHFSESELPVLPSVLLYGLDVGPGSLNVMHSKDRPTGLLEAYIKYETARRDFVHANTVEAIQDLKSAIIIDPQFAMAYWSVGEVLSRRPQPSLAQEDPPGGMV
jgi:hypothetical protein